MPPPNSPPLAAAQPREGAAWTATCHLVLGLLCSCTTGAAGLDALLHLPLEQLLQVQVAASGTVLRNQACQIDILCNRPDRGSDVAGH